MFYALHMWLVGVFFLFVFECQNNVYVACLWLQYISLENMVWRLNIMPEVSKSQASGYCGD